MAEAALDDVFIDDISFPAADGYLLAASLFLPRGAKRHAVLINSATAVPRRIYRGFAGYLARRGCAVLTYDYRGTGDSRQRAMVGYNQRKSLVGFKASMSDWANLDVTAAVNWMRERYHALPLSYVGHSFGGQVLGLLANNTEVSRALLIAAQAGYWKLMTAPERYRVYAMLNLVGTPLVSARPEFVRWKRLSALAGGHRPKRVAMSPVPPPATTVGELWDLRHVTHDRTVA